MLRPTTHAAWNGHAACTSCSRSARAHAKVWTTVGAAMLMLALGGCAAKPGAPATSPPHPVGAMQHFDQAVAPGYAGLSCQQKIDRSLTAPIGYRGVVEGVITGPAVQSFVAVGSDPQNVLPYLDYPFRVISFHGKGRPILLGRPSPYE
jgi:hypothetical protein